MKKKIKYIIILVLSVIFIIGIIFGITFVFNLFNESNDDDSNSDIRLYRNLRIISEHTPYVLAVDEYGDPTTYAVFKNKDYENYEKLFTLDMLHGMIGVETHEFGWSDSYLYILGHYKAAYDLNNGKIKELNSDILYTENDARAEFLGVKDNYVYYKQNSNNQITYKKVDLDFTQVFIIEEDEVPSPAEFISD